jgi:hypothetical protein
MNRLKYIGYSLILFLTTPTLLLASTSGGGALASEINAVSILNQIADLLSGQLLIATATVAGALAFYGFLQHKNGHGSKWEKLMYVGIFLIGVTSIGGVVELLFAGATL